MIDIVGNGASGMAKGPNVPGPNFEVPQPNIVGGMQVANQASVDAAKPFLDMNSAIMDARIKQESLAQQKAQQDRSYGLDQQRLAQNDAQFQQTQQMDQKKLEQQAELAQITQRVAQERLQMDQIKTSMDVEDWTTKTNAMKLTQQMMATNPNMIQDLYSNSDKYTPEEVGKIKSLLFAADSKSAWSFETDQFKENQKVNMSQKEASSIRAAIPILADATNESITLVQQGKPVTEAMKPIHDSIQKLVTTSSVSLPVAIQLYNMAAKSQTEIYKQYTKAHGSEKSYKTYNLKGKEVSPNAPLQEGYFQVNAATGQRVDHSKKVDPIAEMIKGV